VGEGDGEIRGGVVEKMEKLGSESDTEQAREEILLDKR